ncbi:VWA domain-containing protein [Corynebacterium provencense]|uniref:VWA domain-containing protein n=1 Tax=Corynebacterium provencense TaxID=1737425 RepID=UPI0013A60522|nr:VWA domain-containing protein [Corynebacterium provencense]
MSRKRCPHLNGRGGESTKWAEALQEAGKYVDFIDTEGTDGAKIAMIITDGETLDQESAAVQGEVTALVSQDVKVYWVAVGVLGSGKRPPAGATPISLSDPGSFAHTVIRTIVNELAAV